VACGRVALTRDKIGVSIRTSPPLSLHQDRLADLGRTLLAVLMLVLVGFWMDLVQ
jgi:hypothetical protein